jgi:restriction endonuclease-like protein
VAGELVSGAEFSARWTPRSIKDVCGRTHSRYKRELEKSYREYFEAHPKLAGDHPWKARDLEAALPPGWSCLGSLIPRKALHPHHLSGGSSQILAVALLGSAVACDSTLAWLSQLLELSGSFTPRTPRTLFEYGLTRETLNEEPYVTSLDFLAEDDDLLVCGEAKLWEAGLGSCRCGDKVSGEDKDESEVAFTPAQERGACSARILRRPLYYTAASEVFGFPPRVKGHPCPIASSYQAVRNVAAAQALSGGRMTVFALFFDARNPYFKQLDGWPGWPAALSELSRAQEQVVVRASSWQRLLGSGVVPGDVVAWAEDKHGLIASPAN